MTTYHTYHALDWVLKGQISQGLLSGLTNNLKAYMMHMLSYAASSTAPHLVAAYINCLHKYYGRISALPPIYWQ